MQRRATELEEKLLQNEGLVKRLQQETVFLERQHMDVMSEVGCACGCVGCGCHLYIPAG